ncbi:MAG: hypothetical protein OEX04_18410, partial [Acidimicrobiia bacterium]|nr:hypothetical protein [Acidimicrobiia bacterium]
LKPATAGAVAIAAGFGLQQWWIPEGLLSVGAQGAIVMAIYAVAVAAMGVEPEDRMIISKFAGKGRGLVRKVRR